AVRRRINESYLTAHGAFRVSILARGCQSGDTTSSCQPSVPCEARDQRYCRRTLELSGGVAVRLNDWLDGTRCAVGGQHDSAALKAQQCRGGCGLRAKNEPLTKKATLRQTARMTKPEDAR